MCRSNAPCYENKHSIIPNRIRLLPSSTQRTNSVEARCEAQEANANASRTTTVACVELHNFRGLLYGKIRGYWKGNGSTLWVRLVFFRMCSVPEHFLNHYKKLCTDLQNLEFGEAMVGPKVCLKSGAARAATTCGNCSRSALMTQYSLRIVSG